MFFFLPQVEMKSSGMSPAVVWCAPMETNLRSSSLSLRSMDGLASSVKMANTCVETREAHWWATGSVWKPRPCGSTECCTTETQIQIHKVTRSFPPDTCSTNGFSAIHYSLTFFVNFFLGVCEISVVLFVYNTVDNSSIIIWFIGYNATLTLFCQFWKQIQQRLVI